MPQLGYYQQGDWNAQCDQCGRGFKFSQLRFRWDKAWVCGACWEIRQPQDLVRGVKDDQSVPVGRPRIINYLGSAQASSSPLGGNPLGNTDLGGP